MVFFSLRSAGSVKCLHAECCIPVDTHHVWAQSSNTVPELMPLAGTHDGTQTRILYTNTHTHRHITYHQAPLTETSDLLPYHAKVSECTWDGLQNDEPLTLTVCCMVSVRVCLCVGMCIKSWSAGCSISSNSRRITWGLWSCGACWPYYVSTHWLAATYWEGPLLPATWLSLR